MRLVGSRWWLLHDGWDKRRRGTSTKDAGARCSCQTLHMVVCRAGRGSNGGLGLHQLDVSQLAIGARLGRARQDDHALVGVDRARNVLKLHWQKVHGHETGVLAAAAVITVWHGVVHARVGDDLTSLRVHLRGAPKSVLWSKRSNFSHNIISTEVTVSKVAIPPG